MFEYLKSLAARLMRRITDAFPPPHDPAIGVREPRRRGPGGRSSGVALEEPIERSSTAAIGRDRRRS
jgi:hypothetical protein